MKLVVIGAGYVGLVTSACFSEVGHKVMCVDIDKNKVEAMKSGICPIYEPRLDELMKENYDKGNLDFTTDYIKAYENVDVIFVAVGTPERSDGSANLNYVFEVCKQIIKNVKNDCLIVIKSTVPIGTNEKIEKYFMENKKEGIKLEVASNPEFLAQGTAVKDTLEASRIIIGVESRNAEKILKEIYKPFNKPIVVMNRKSAEMVKYASNDFLALKISFINEIANFCEIVGANINDVTKGMSYDERIGNKFLNAGLGYGGSCFPKDTKALHWLANDHGYEIKTIKAAIEVNENQKYRLFRKLKDRFKNLSGKKIAILGITFKPGTDDLREAPSIPNIRRLLEEESIITVYDPAGMENLKKIYPDEISYADSVKQAVENQDAVLIFTEWSEIRNLSKENIQTYMKDKVVFDGRNCLRDDFVKGIEYYAIGK